MKVSTVAILFSGASARFMEAGENDNVVLYPEEAAAERYHIELSPGETYWVTEEEKWEHRRVGLRSTRNCNPSSSPTNGTNS